MMPNTFTIYRFNLNDEGNVAKAYLLGYTSLTVPPDHSDFVRWAQLPTMAETVKDFLDEFDYFWSTEEYAIALVNE